MVLFSRPRIEWALTILGILKAGAVAVPLDAQLRALEAQRIVVQSDAKAIFVAQDRLKAVRELGLQVISLDREQGPNDELLYLDDLLHNEEKVEIRRAAEDLAVIAFTSGTMGDAKGVMLTHGNFSSDVAACLKRMSIGPHDVMLSIAPWYHSYGLTAGLLVPFWAGATAVYTDNYRKLPRIMKETETTVLLAPPKLYHVMYQRVREKVGKSLPGRLAFHLIPKQVGKRVKEEMASSQLRFFVSGGAPLDPQVAKDFRRMGIGIVEGYGLTETAPVLAFSQPFDRKVGTIGPILPGMEVKIQDPNEEGIGEILVRGPNVMRGYYKNPERTAEVLDEEGWFHTGDLGWLDKQGYIYIKGRRKNVIVLESGKNVYPEEIEWELSRIPYIEEVLVKRGQRQGREVVQAYVYPNWDQLGTSDPQVARELIWQEVKRVSTGLASYKRLTRKEELILVDKPFAKTSTMDIKRYLYQEGER